MLTEQAAKQKAEDWLDGSSLSLESLAQLLLATDREAREAYQKVPIGGNEPAATNANNLIARYMLNGKSDGDRPYGPLQDEIQWLLEQWRDSTLSPFRAANLVAPDGGPRMVLGTLPVTADGHFIVPGIKAWCIRTAKWKWVGERGTPSYKGIEDYTDYPEPREVLVSHVGALGSPLQRVGVLFPCMSFSVMTLPEWLFSTEAAAASALAARGEVEG